jgi:hypothetical protein
MCSIAKRDLPFWRIIPVPNLDAGEHALPDQSQQFASDTPAGRPGVLRAISATVSAVAVVALLSGLLIALHARQSASGAPTPTPVTAPVLVHCPGQTASALACPVTDQGITIQALYAYADALSTQVQVAISGAVNMPSIVEAVLIDAQGHRFSDAGLGSGYNGKNPSHVIGDLGFAPLPAGDLRQPQRLMLLVTHILPTIPPGPSGKPYVTGKWQSSFTVVPTPGKLYHVTMAPVVEQGIGIQAPSLEVAPTAQTPIGQRGGVRVILTITGLPANALATNFQNLSPTRQVVCSEACDPAFAILTLPGWALAQAANLTIIPLAPPAPVAQQTVGPAGTLQLELLYPGQGMPNGGTASLVIANARLWLAGDPNPIHLPTWQLTLPLQG